MDSEDEAEFDFVFKIATISFGKSSGAEIRSRVCGAAI
jgi:hypothetical protein